MQRTVPHHTDPLRNEYLGTDGDFEDVEASTLNLAHPYNVGLSLPEHRWVVYISTHRHPNVGGIVSLPQDIAALCTKHCLCLPTEEFREKARRGFIDFLQRLGSSAADADIIDALRPHLRSADLVLEGDSLVASRPLDDPALDPTVSEDDASEHSSDDDPPGDVGRGQDVSLEIVREFGQLRLELKTVLDETTDDDARCDTFEHLNMVGEDFAEYSLKRAKALRSLLDE